jgi:hypothetical protein
MASLRLRPLAAALALGALVAGAAVPVGAEPVKCQKTIVQQLAKLKKQVLRRSRRSGAQRSVIRPVQTPRTSPLHARRWRRTATAGGLQTTARS